MASQVKREDGKVWIDGLMTLRKSWIILAGGFLVIAAVMVWVFLLEEDLDGNAEQLVAKLGAEEKESVLRKLGLRARRREDRATIIGRKLAALGDEGVEALAGGLETSGSILLWIRTPTVVAHLGPGRSRLVGQLIRGLKCDCAKRPYAMMALREIGPPAVDAAPALVSVLEGTDTALQPLAAEVLGRIGPGAKEAVPALVKALASANARTRWCSAVALESIDVAAAAGHAKGVLAETAKGAEHGLRRQAEEALDRVAAWEKVQDAATSQPAAGQPGGPQPRSRPGGR